VADHVPASSASSAIPLAYFNYTHANSSVDHIAEKFLNSLLGAVAAESLAVKHQLLIMKRAQRRAPNLTSWDRLVLGVCALLVSPKRLSKMAVILKPSTLLCFHHALVKRKYRLLL
jgi:hypothetical protein